MQASSKEQNCLPRWQDHSFGYPISGTGFLQYVSIQWSSPCMGGWGLITLPSPRVPLMWTQQHVWSSGVIEQFCLCSGVREHLLGDQLDCVNLKGILEEVPICESTFSIDATSSLRSWAVLPVCWRSAVLCVSAHFGSILILAHVADRSLIPM